MKRLLLFAALVALARPAAAQQYDPMPLRGSNALDTGAVERERQAFLAWAGEERELTPDERLDAQQRVYFVIASAVKQNLFAQYGHRPRFPLPDLAQLFEHAARLGVHGAAQVARALPLRPEDAIGQAPPVPDSMSVEFAPPLLRVSSARGGWSLEVPYYYMISEVRSFEAGGMPTESVMISTLFAAHEDGVSTSQSTILLTWSPTERHDDFGRFWLIRMGIAPDDRVADSPREGATTYRTYDEENDIHTEAVLFRTARGPMMVAYLGNTGPFAANRPNFLDFLAHLRVQ